ncbi:sugar kinase [Salipiger sp.]|uniref:sugar kinase n=1 Tax=Salipiger sp. TaxID=2078585 RepID=UPI003A9730DD
MTGPASAPPLKAPPTVTAIGECMVELSPAGAPLAFRTGFAGDTYNTAWYLRQLRPEWRVRYATAIGRDALSDAMLAAMTGAGIATDHVQRLPDRSVGLYLIALSGGERSFSYWRSESAARCLARDPELLAEAVRGAALVYLSGITLAILDDAGRRTLFDTLDTARANGSLVAFDPNLRPRLWHDLPSMRATITRAAGRSDIVLPSFEDEAGHFGDDSPEATLTRYLRGATRSVFVKDGPGDVIYAHRGARGRVTPAPVAQVIDTTSAGDSFNAGVLAALLSGSGPDAAVRLGAATAAQVVARRGALVPLQSPGAPAPQS